MKTISEIAHETNLNSFEKLVSYLNKYQVEFKFKNSLINNEKLNQVAKDAQTANKLVYILTEEYCKTLQIRENGFESILDTVAILRNYFSGNSGFEQELRITKQISNFQTIATPDLERLLIDIKDSGKHLREIDLMDTKYNKTLQGIAVIIDLLISKPTYNSKESGFSIKSLQEKHSNLEIAHTQLKDLKTKINAARMGRSCVIYKANVGLVDVAHDTKAHIRSTYGGESKEWKDLSAIEFKRIKK